MAVFSILRRGDILITSDYGLASLALGKKAEVIRPDGMIIDDRNIDMLLMDRFLGKKSRKAGIRTKGPAPFTRSDRENFIRVLRERIARKTGAGGMGND